MSQNSRYYVVDDNYIPLRSNPDNGLTLEGAIVQAIGEAICSSKILRLSLLVTSKWYHICDTDFHVHHEFDKIISEVIRYGIQKQQF
jgi:hypothetical protein